MIRAPSGSPIAISVFALPCECGRVFCEGDQRETSPTEHIPTYWRVSGRVDVMVESIMDRMTYGTEDDNV